jgi:hypothetical protein
MVVLRNSKLGKENGAIGKTLFRDNNVGASCDLEQRDVGSYGIVTLQDAGS